MLQIEGKFTGANIFANIAKQATISFPSKRVKAEPT